jgi:hypothetical protein
VIVIVDPLTAAVKIVTEREGIRKREERTRKKRTRRKVSWMIDIG